MGSGHARATNRSADGIGAVAMDDKEILAMRKQMLLLQQQNASLAHENATLRLKELEREQSAAPDKKKGK